MLCGAGFGFLGFRALGFGFRIFVFCFCRVLGLQGFRVLWF